MAVKSLKRAQRKIQIKDLKLNALLDVSLAINSNVPKEKLFSIYENVLRELDIEKLVLYTQEADWSMALSYGVEGAINLDVEKDLLQFEDIAEVNSKTEGPFAGFDLVVPVHHKTKPLAFLLIGDIINEAIQISPIIKHLPFIQTFTNIIAVAIENKHLAKEALRQEGIKKELALASEMQNMLLPNKLPKNEKIDIAAFYQSHQQVGGDYYDVFWTGEDKIAFCIADVSGKGVSAAILMSNFQANMQAGVKHQESLPELVHDLNQKVMDSAQGEKFITMFIATYDFKTRLLRYINCGHNPPILMNSGNLLELKNGCPGLGMIDDLPPPMVSEITIEKGSTLVCYTDGLVEVENSVNQQFETEGIGKVLQFFPNIGMAELNAELIKALKNFKGDQPYVDDIAILSCNFR